MNQGINMFVFGQLFEGAYMVNQDRKIMFWNKAAEKLTGYKATEVVGRRCDDNILMHVNEKGENFCEKYCPLQQSMNDGKLREITVFLRHKEGYRVPVSVRAIPITDGKGLIQGSIEVFSKENQVSPEKMKELTRKAFVDGLTGLPNKEYSYNKLKSMLSTPVPGDDGCYGVLFLELDNLEKIQEEFGMVVRNKTIEVAGKTIFENLLPGDLAARWEGGLFLIITRLDRKSLLLNWADSVKSLIRKSTVPEYDKVAMSVKVGGSIINCEQNVDTVLNRLEQELKNSRNIEGNISIREL